MRKQTFRVGGRGQGKSQRYKEMKDEYTEALNLISKVIKSRIPTTLQPPTVAINSRIDRPIPSSTTNREYHPEEKLEPATGNQGPHISNWSKRNGVIIEWIPDYRTNEMVLVLDGIDGLIAVHRFNRNSLMNIGDYHGLLDTIYPLNESIPLFLISDDNLFGDTIQKYMHQDFVDDTFYQRRVQGDYR